MLLLLIRLVRLQICGLRNERLYCFYNEKLFSSFFQDTEAMPPSPRESFPVQYIYNTSTPLLLLFLFAKWKISIFQMDQTSHLHHMWGWIGGRRRVYISEGVNSVIFAFWLWLCCHCWRSWNKYDNLLHYFACPSVRWVNYLAKSKLYFKKAFGENKASNCGHFFLL